MSVMFQAGPADAARQEREAAPSQLPHVAREMLTAGFWISQHPSANKTIMTAKQVEDFNRHVRDDLGLTRDIFALTASFKTGTLLADFDKTYNDFKKKDLFTADGTHNSAGYLDKARLNINTPDIMLGVAPRYGLVVRYVDVRFFPTDEPLYESPFDIDFDQVQDSTLDLGTPVAVVHQSADKKWYYAYSALSRGWVEADCIALGDAKIVKDFTNAAEFAVAMAPKGEVYLDASMTILEDTLRMGGRLPFIKEEDGKINVRVPAVDAKGALTIIDGYVSARQFQQGYLPYTAANVLRQAFAMLNQPYGWGGMYGEQDCSAFLDEVFATMGIILPRDSKDQANAGHDLKVFKPDDKIEDKLKAFEDVPAGAVILPMKGHIMLYLGSVEGRPYAIHCLWAYRKRAGERDVPMLINKVAVTGLMLGDGSRKGSLLKRLAKITAIEAP